MSHLPIPSEFPLPRAVHYQMLEASTNTTGTNHVTYTIQLVESWVEDGVDKHFQHTIGTYIPSFVFGELQELYEEYNVHGGFVFSMDSIAMRMKSMNRVLCWFGFRDSHKYTCFVERVTS